MRRTDVFQIRIEPELRDRLARLRDERHVNVSAWARDVIAAALDRDSRPPSRRRRDNPSPAGDPASLTTAGAPCLTDPMSPRSRRTRAETPISITDSRGGSWTATSNEVVSRNQQRIVVRDTGRP